ncbi:hypothetical protein SISNIDRAFT_401104, partial [Sistotremastrum niveocremeum HHB9708]
MVSCRDMFNINQRLGKALNKSGEPFGGLSVIFAGDFAQLPPARGRSLFSAFAGLFFSEVPLQESAFGKSLWHQVTTVVILKQNMRSTSQTQEDRSFRIALENMRYAAATERDIALL